MHLDARIKLTRQMEVAAEDGSVSVEVLDIGSVAARASVVSSVETDRGAVQAADFRVRASPTTRGVRMQDCIEWQGRHYAIESITPDRIDRPMWITLRGATSQDGSASGLRGTPYTGDTSGGSSSWVGPNTFQVRIQSSNGAPTLITIGDDFTISGNTLTLSEDYVTQTDLITSLSGLEASMTFATEEEMTAGTEPGKRSMSPLRVAQAIEALSTGGGSVPALTIPDVPLLDAGLHFAEQVDSRIAGLTGTSGERLLFASMTHTGTPAYVRSSSHWAADVDLTGVGVWNSAAGTQIGFTAISARHVLICHHSTLADGTTLRWVTAGNVIVERTLSSSARIGSTDLRVGLLSSALPGTITPVRMAPADLITLCGMTAVPYAVVDQEMKLNIADAQSSITAIGAGGGARAAWYEVGISGDSGHPWLLLVDGAACMVSFYSLDSAGPDIPGNLAAIQSAMDTAAAGYTLDAADMPGGPDWTAVRNRPDFGTAALLDASLTPSGGQIPLAGPDGQIPADVLGNAGALRCYAQFSVIAEEPFVFDVVKANPGATVSTFFDGSEFVANEDLLTIDTEGSAESVTWNGSAWSSDPSVTTGMRIQLDSAGGGTYSIEGLAYVATVPTHGGYALDVPLYPKNTAVAAATRVALGITGGGVTNPLELGTEGSDVAEIVLYNASVGGDVTISNPDSTGSQTWKFPDGSSTWTFASQEWTSSTLSSYVTGTALTSTLSSYVLTSALSAYVTSASLTSTLSSYVTSASLTSTLGSYATTAALNALLPSQTGNSGKFLTTNGTALTWGTPGGGGVTNPLELGTEGSSTGSIILYNASVGGDVTISNPDSTGSQVWDFPDGSSTRTFASQEWTADQHYAKLISSSGSSVFSSTTLADMHSSVHLSLDVGTYDIVVFGSYTGGATSTTEGFGVGFAFTGTATVTDGLGAILVTSSTESYGVGTTLGTALLTGTAGPGSLRWPFRVELRIDVTVAGTFKLQGKSETGLTMTVPAGALRIFCAKQ